jgi:hypothetical protein
MALGLMLAACSAEPTVTVDCGVTTPASGSTKGQGKSLITSMASSDVATFDASSMSATFNSSGGIVSDSGVFTVTLKAGGAVVASSQFNSTRSGNTFTASDPAAVSGWVHGYANSVDEIDVSIDNVGLQDIQGTNTLTVNANYGGASYGSSTSTWQGLNYQHY